MVAAGSVLRIIMTPGSSAMKVVEMVVSRPMQSVWLMSGPVTVSEVSWSLRVTKTTLRPRSTRYSFSRGVTVFWSMLISIFSPSTGGVGEPGEAAAFDRAARKGSDGWCRGAAGDCDKGGKGCCQSDERRYAAGSGCGHGKILTGGGWWWRPVLLARATAATTRSSLARRRHSKQLRFAEGNGRGKRTRRSSKRHSKSGQRPQPSARLADRAGSGRTYGATRRWPQRKSGYSGWGGGGRPSTGASASGCRRRASPAERTSRTCTSRRTGRPPPTTDRPEPKLSSPTALSASSGTHRTPPEGQAGADTAGG